MGLKDNLTTFVKVVLDEAERNLEFRQRLERALASASNQLTPGQVVDKPRKGGRRTPALLDPVEVVRESEAKLRERLSGLDLERLRDVVAQYGMDPGKLVMKWKDRDRVIDRIIEVSMGRSTKGDAFRAE
jgi:hypothetical protein